MKFSVQKIKRLGQLIFSRYKKTLIQSACLLFALPATMAGIFFVFGRKIFAALGALGRMAGLSLSWVIPAFCGVCVLFVYMPLVFGAKRQAYLVAFEPLRTPSLFFYFKKVSSYFKTVFLGLAQIFGTVFFYTLSLSPGVFSVVFLSVFTKTAAANWPKAFAFRFLVRRQSFCFPVF